jgi:hypothetical protein
VHNQWAESVAEEVASMGGTFVLAERYGYRFGYSLQQARHILNRAAEYGTIEKFRLADEGIRLQSDGAKFGYRVPTKGGT